MSFWSRSKSKKDTPSSLPTTTTTTTTASATPTSTPLSASSTPTSTPSSIPIRNTNNNSNNGMSSPPTSYSSARNNPQSPPDSPSTINGTAKAPPNAPPLWSMRKFRNVCPFPRFGHAANVTAGKEGEIYVFGGLVKEKRKNDLFVIDSGNSLDKVLISGSMTAYSISATGDGPSPRLGHASILVGNAFILFGGECATTDLAHDDSLYLLNTSTRQWTRAVTVGPRPAPRYGHTLNILGSRLLVFGGQVDGYYFNDLVTFDLNTLSSTNARWELVQAVTDPPSARTGHVCLSLGDKLVIFGGTDGVQWFNDTWFFDARSNSWIEVDCVGHIPSPREGHSAALIGDTMFIFGGRGSDGKMLGDLYAFKVNGIPLKVFSNEARKWYSFTNMGIGPGPRCGHTLTTSRDKIIVLGGESSSNVAGKDESTVAFVLDTSRIRFPAEPSRTNSSQRIRNLTSPPPRPSSRQTDTRESRQTDRSDFRSTDRGESRGESRQIDSRDESRQGDLRIDSRNQNDPPRESSRPNTANRSDPEPAEFGERLRSPSPGSRVPRGLTPQSSSMRSRASPLIGGMAASLESESLHTKHTRDVSETSVEKRDSPDEPKHTTLESPQMSVDELKRKLAWANTELALAQSKGFTSSEAEVDDVADILAKNDIPMRDTRLLQALLSTRHQLARVKEMVNDQTRQASERIVEAERQRDEALNEVAYARARLAAASGEGVDQPDRASDLSAKLVSALTAQNELMIKVEHLTTQLTVEQGARKLAEETAASHLQKFNELDKRRKENWIELEEVRGKYTEVARLLNDARVENIEHEAVANKLRIESEEWRKQVAELTELADTQSAALKAVRASVTSATDRAETAEKSLNSERTIRMELERQVVQLKQENATVESLRSKISDLENQLEKARDEADSAREALVEGLGNLTTRPPVNTDYEGRIQLLQDQLNATKSVHMDSVSTAEQAQRDLARANERIASLEQMHSESVKETANLHARLSESLDQLHTVQEDLSKTRSRLSEVQRDLDVSNVKHSAMKQLLNERPASASPMMRSMTATPEFSNKIRDLERQLEESQKLREELEASQEQVMQNLSVASKRHKEATRRQREAEERVKKLEEELDRQSVGSSSADITEANRRQAEAEKKLADSTIVFQDRLAQLEADYQSAVHYVKGTEKMIRRMKDELTKYKSQNAFLQTELHELKRQSMRPDDTWEAEKERMVKEMEALQVSHKSEVATASEQIKDLQARLDQHAEERDALKMKLADLQKEHETAAAKSRQLEQQAGNKPQLEEELVRARETAKRLEQENQKLESRAMEAEEKVSLLLDQVENSVDTYRQSIGTTRRTDGNSPPISPRSSSVGNRTSLALDSLAHELDQLRSHWESSTAKYRLSTASSIGRDSPTRPTGLGLRTFDLSSDRVNGIHDDIGLSRWRDEDLPSPHVRQVTA